MMEILYNLLLMMLILLLLLLSVNGLKISKRIVSGKSWKYIDKFSFMSSSSSNKVITNYGVFKFDIYHNNNDIDTLFLLGYSYRDMSKYVNDIKLKEEIVNQRCTQLMSKASYIYSISSSSKYSSNNNDKNVNDYKYVDNINEIVTSDILLSSSPSIMIWVIASCTMNTNDNKKNKYNEGPIDIYFSSHFYHMIPGSSSDNKKNTKREVSYENFSLPALAVIFFCGHLLLVIVMTYICRLLELIGKYHYTVKLLYFSFVCYLGRYFFIMIYWLSFDSSGNDTSGLKIIGNIFFILSDTAMIIVFMLLSSGWTIVRRKIKMIGRIRITFFTSCYLSLLVIAIIWIEESPEGRVISTYTSPPGILTLVLLAVASIRILAAIRTTATNFPEQRLFFMKLRVLAMLYTLRLPLVALFTIGSSEIDSVIVFASIDYAVVFICQSTLALLFHPNLFPEQFPFHAKLDDMILYRLNKSQAESKSNTNDNNNDDNNNNDKKVISFTGGYENANLVDENNGGRVKPPSAFDRLQLSKLKDVVKTFGKRISSLLLYQKKMEDVLDAFSIDYLPVNSNDDSNDNDNNYHRNNSDSDDDNNTHKKTKAIRKYNSNNNTNTSTKQFTPKVLPPSSRNPYTPISSLNSNTNDDDNDSNINSNSNNSNNNSNSNNKGDLLSALDRALMNR